ncbi:MAG: DotH/IcmK family type IV secretion protein [Methylococcales bacterium]
MHRGFVSSLVFVDSTGAPWPVVAYDLARYEFSHKEYSKSQKYLISSIMNAPSIINRLPIRGKSNSLLGVIEMRVKKDKIKAEEYFKVALNDVPDDYMALISLGIIEADKNKLGAASGYFERALTLYPNDSTINYVYTNYLIQSGANDNKIVLQLSKTISTGYDRKSLQNNKNIRPYLVQLNSGKQLKISISYGYKWRLLNPDIISITNTSNFDLTNTSLDVIYREQKKGKISQWFKHPKASLRIRKISIGTTININSFNSTKKRLYDVHIELKSDQGVYKFGLMNNLGELISYSY